MNHASQQIDLQVSETVLMDWQDALEDWDIQQLADFRARGAELTWRHKALVSIDGRTISHHTVVMSVPSRKHPLGVAGPVDFRYRDRDAMIRRLVRSVLGQARATFEP